MALDQASRMLGLKTPLGDNVLLLTGFRGQEEMSRLFHFQLEMLSDDNAIAAKDIVGQNVTFSIKLADSTPRYFNGFVNRFYAADEDRTGRRTYRAEVVPWVWFLTRTSDQRIFQNKTVPQIIEQIFGDLGFSDFSLKLSGNHPKHEYVVQYRESDFQFVSRLAEEEGIFYYFQHTDGKHTMLMSDQTSGYVDCLENEVDYPWDFGSRAEKSYVTSWEHRYEFRTGKFAHTDFNFKTPSTSLMANSSTTMKLPGVDKYEYYEFPGSYGTGDDGRKLADMRMEAEEVEHDVVEGKGLCRSFSPGHKFQIKRHRSASEQNKSYVVTSVAHQATEMNPYETGGSAEGEYTNSFKCIPDKVISRPVRATQRPLIQGVQTAIVVGPAGEEIYPDEFGRVKVQFHWDREGKKDENSSCWIRVSQVHAGKGFGGIDIPRIGEEVVISFEEGDPNRPLITGRVYHAENMPPFGLPGAKTISGLKSNSTKGGGGYNEYVMDDTKGNELIREHGQFDKDSTIEHDLREHVLHDRSRDVTNNETIAVGNDRSKSVGHDETTSVGNNRTETVGTNETITIGADRTESVGKNETVTVTLTRTHTVGINDALTVGAMQEVTVGAMRALTVGANQTTNVGISMSETIGKDRTESVGKNRTQTVGDNRSSTVAKNDTLNVGKKLVITAGEEIAITTGKASILMKKDGTITISGKDITITGTGKITGKASKDMVLKGKKILQN